MDYVNGMSKLYLTSKDLSEGERKQILKSIQDFSSIAKVGKLSTLFLSEFADLVVSFDDGQGLTKEQLHEYDMRLEVLLSLMEKVTLKKDNYIQLMKGNKEFLKVSST
jgi:hypothetical protein